MANYDQLASIMNIGPQKQKDSFAWGVVTRVEQSSFVVSVAGQSVSASKCCFAIVGDVVALECMNGKYRAIARKGRNGEQKVLWTGELLMSLNQEAELSEPVSIQPNGIVLVWSFYDGSSSANSDWCYHFVPKFAVVNSITSGGGIHVQLGNSTWSSLCQKYVYVHDEKLKGNDVNKTGNASSFVLRYVLGI